MPAYLLREWERLPYGEGEGHIPRHHADSLAALAARSAFAGRGGSGVLEHGRNALRARGVVGILVAGDASLEILPKIDCPPDQGDADAAVRKRLVHMLAVALDLRIDTGTVTDLAWQNETLLEILIRIFCDKLTEALRKGMPRRYVAHEDDLPNLRGRLDVARQFTRNAVNPARLACRFDLLSEDIALNRIMKATVTRLARLSRRAANQQRLRELAFVYADIADVPVTALRWDEVVIDRTSHAWRDLVEMARLFLQQRYQTTTHGGGEGTALLFEMNALFEEYVGRMIIRALSGSGLSVSLQGGGRYCLCDVESDTRLFQTRPDILISRNGKHVHIIDTKWKRIAPHIDDPKQGISQADVYQMIAYANLYDVPRLTLLYPHHPELGERDAVLRRFTITGQPTVIEIANIDVADGSGMADRLRQLIMGVEPALVAGIA